MKLPSVLFLLLILLAMSCEKNDLNPEPTLVFGEAFGYCVGDCAHFYKINDHQIYKDDIERFWTDPPTFNPAPLSDSEYELAQSLLTNFPEYLLQNPNQTYGCPDCADQGGIYIFYTKGKATNSWRIDTYIDNQPTEIRAYLKELRDVIEALED